MPKSPIGPCVCVTWHYGLEFVPIHPKHQYLEPFKTVEFVKPNTWLLYHPRVRRLEEGSQLVFEIKYARDEHPELEDYDIQWGTSRIVIDTIANTVQAHWMDDYNSENDGECKARLIEQGERLRESARPVVRNQSQLRNLLLATDKVCAVTGEGTESVLECAHVVPVEKGGFEYFSNAFLLRSDLHCLYDSSKFSIRSNGSISKIAKDISMDYQTLLKGKRIDETLTSRLSAALVRRSNSLKN